MEEGIERRPDMVFKAKEQSAPEQDIQELGIQGQDIQEQNIQDRDMQNQDIQGQHMQTKYSNGQYMQELFQMQDMDIKEYSPLALAYIGDAVYDLIIRSLVLNEGNRQVQKMHKRTSSMVQASAQARMITALNDQLSAEEHAVYKRGRNAKSMSPARNQSVSDYHKATGFEALMGYLYLKKEWKRMLDLIKEGLDSLENEEC